jgi:hypothetical protein
LLVYRPDWSLLVSSVLGHGLLPFYNPVLLRMFSSAIQNTSDWVDTGSELVDLGGMLLVLSFKVSILSDCLNESSWTVLLFAMIASKLKMNAPYCHTSVLSEVQGKSADVTVSLKSSTLDGVLSPISSSCSSVSPQMSSLAVSLLLPT